VPGDYWYWQIRFEMMEP